MSVKLHKRLSSKKKSKFLSSFTIPVNAVGIILVYVAFFVSKIRTGLSLCLC